MIATLFIFFFSICWLCIWIKMSIDWKKWKENWKIKMKERIRLNILNRLGISIGYHYDRRGRHIYCIELFLVGYASVKYAGTDFESKQKFYNMIDNLWMNLLLGIILWLGVNNLLTRYSSGSTPLLTHF